MDLTEFNEIRPYNDEELPQIFEELIADPAFRKAATGAIPNVPFELLAQKMRTCKTKLDFQKAFCYGILWKIAEEHTNGLTLDHNALPNKKKAYTYISNHRDIILDSGFLSILLVDQGMDTVEIAIGDNLLIYPWIKKLVSTSLLLFSGHLRCARCWRLRRGCPDICIIPLQRKINLFGLHSVKDGRRILMTARKIVS